MTPNTLVLRQPLLRDEVNTPVLSYEVVTSFSVSEARNLFVYVNDGTDVTRDA